MDILVYVLYRKTNIKYYQRVKNSSYIYFLIH